MVVAETLGNTSRAGALLGAVALCCALVGCGSSAATQALVADGLPPPREAPKDAEHYPLSGSTTKVEVDINGFVSYTLRFPQISGNLVLAPNALEQSLAKVVVDTRSATTDNGELARIAKSKDFLDVETYPQATFEVRGLTKKAEADQYEMIGVLELRGTAKAVTVPFTMTTNACKTLVTTEFSVNRRQFGVESDTLLDGMASDEVGIRVRLEVPRDGAPASCSQAAAR